MKDKKTNIFLNNFFRFVYKLSGTPAAARHLVN